MATLLLLSFFHAIFFPDPQIPFLVRLNSAITIGCQVWTKLIVHDFRCMILRKSTRVRVSIFLVFLLKVANDIIIEIGLMAADGAAYQ